MEKYALMAQRLAVERPRNPKHLVTVRVEHETDENGEPVVIVVRMRKRQKARGKPAKRK
jgi:hypothetical protein